MRKMMVLLLGLAAMLFVVSPTQAHAEVAVGVAVGVGGPVYVHPVRPYFYGPVYVHPRPVYPYAYAPGYVYPRPYWGPYWYRRPYGYHAYLGPRPYIR